MPKIKKTRKVGQIGIRSVPKSDRAPNQASGRIRKKNGKAAGSRQNVEKQHVDTNKGTKQSNDVRHGSKKPVPLIADGPQTKSISKPKYYSPKQELAAIENDPRLGSLLDKLDNGKKIKPDEQKYVEQQLSRHKALCALLGIDTEEDNDDPQEVDIIDQFEHSNLDNFR